MLFFFNRIVIPIHLLHSTDHVETIQFIITENLYLQYFTVDIIRGEISIVIQLLSLAIFANHTHAFRLYASYAGSAPHSPLHTKSNYFITLKPSQLSLNSMQNNRFYHLQSYMSGFSHNKFFPSLVTKW